MVVLSLLLLKDPEYSDETKARTIAVVGSDHKSLSPRKKSPRKYSPRKPKSSPRNRSPRKESPKRAYRSKSPLRSPLKRPLTGPKVEPFTKKHIEQIKSLPIYEEELENIDLNKIGGIKRREKLEKQRENKYEGRGIKTRGWGALSPKKGRGRNELYEKCGSKCYMDPENLKFPICPDLKFTKGKCVLDRRGLQAAKQRAQQYGYTKIADKVEQIESELL